ncbi:MAG: FkbM family methyltransferase [Marinibacterium sp.]
MSNQKTSTEPDPAATAPDFAHFIAENEHGRYCVPQEFAHREVPGILAGGGVYEPDTLAMLSELYDGGDIVSGGAFVGDFFPFLCRLLVPGARVVSFEPHPVTLQAARHTIALNGLDAVDLHPVAVGADAGSLPLQMARANGQPLAAAAKLVTEAEAAGNDHVVSVDVVRLDDLVAPDRPVGILHLDIEGHEEPALHGARDLIARWRPLVVLETSRRRRDKTIARYRDVLAGLVPEAGYDLAHLVEADGNAVYRAGSGPE